MKYGFIGCGNMGGAIARALRNSTSSILISDPSEKAACLAKNLGCDITINEDIIQKCNYVFLAVKPQALEAVLTPLSALLKIHRPVIVTMAAGVEISKIEKMIETAKSRR
jgi:pyrroline-5-carboxylate reductase